MKKISDNTLIGNTTGQQFNVTIDDQLGHTMLIAPFGTGMTMPVEFGLTEAEFDSLKANRGMTAKE